MQLEKERPMRYVFVASLVLAGVCAHAWGQQNTRSEDQKWMMSLEAKNTPLGEVLVRAARSTQLSLILDPAAQVKGKPAGEVLVTGKFNDVDVRDLLLMILTPMRLDHMTVDGVILVSDRPRRPTLIYEEIPGEVLEKLEKTKVSYHVEGEPLRTVTERAATAAGFAVRFDLHADVPMKEANVYCTIHDMPVRTWLDWAARLGKCTWRVEGKTVVVTDRLWEEDAETLQRMRKKVVTFWIDNQPVEPVLDYLRTRAKVNAVVDPSALAKVGKTVTLNMTDVTVEDGMRALARKTGLQQGIWRGSVVLTDKQGARWLRTAEKASILSRPEPTPADHKTTQKLNETLVSFQFIDQPIDQVFKYLATLANVGIVVDESLIKDPGLTLSLQLTNVSLQRALQMVCWQKHWRCAIVDGTVHITNEEGLKHLEARVGLHLVPLPRQEGRKKTGEIIVDF